MIYLYQINKTWEECICLSKELKKHTKKKQAEIQITMYSLGLFSLLAWVVRKVYFMAKFILLSGTIPLYIQH